VTGVALSRSREIGWTSLAVRRWQFAVALLPVALVAVVGVVGADSRWLAALGAWVVAHGIPSGVPYATAPSAGWADATILGQVLFHALDAAGGDRGLLLAQACAVAAAFWFLSVDMARQGAGAVGSLAIGLLVLVGGLTSFVVVRAQLLSLVLFPLLVLLLRAEARRPSRRIWLVVPLVALWANLHGAVLTGVGVVAIYLAFGRARRDPLLSAGVLLGTVLAACATPVLWRTPRYYFDVLDNEAARRGFGMWAPLSMSGWDILLVAAVVALIALAVRRLGLWELVALVALGVLTIHSGRGGIWLLLFLAPPAAAALTRRNLASGPINLAIASLVLIAAVGLAHGPRPNPDRALVATAIQDAGGKAILAEDLLGEDVALQGGRVWVANPIDAFGHGEQRIYLDWLQGKPAGDEAVRHARVVLVTRGSQAQRRIARNPRATVIASTETAIAYSLAA
jgi:hypothetical protein